MNLERMMSAYTLLTYAIDRGQKGVKTEYPKVIKLLSIKKLSLIPPVRLLRTCHCNKHSKGALILV